MSRIIVYTINKTKGITMSSVKTAISIEDSLLQKVDSLSRKLKIPRSRLFAMAIDNFIKNYQNRKLFDAINAAYNDSLSSAEKRTLQTMKKKYQKLVNEEW
jgi:metal-responsive CopG/Arc/MetJ family transcriptional regulator